MNYDKVIIGAGLYGLYAADLCGKNKQKILVLEYEDRPFRRATYINQARVHKGYHYPRSLSTALKSAHYFDRFMNDYKFCVLTSFNQVYATSKKFSWTDAKQFKKFCTAANIRCDEISPEKYFNFEMCDGAFLTEEYTYDASILRDYFLDRIATYNNVEVVYNARISQIKKTKSSFEIIMTNNSVYNTNFLLNATYASTNQVSILSQYEPFKIKYELCEIILCKVNDNLANTGITVMDGPFFSIMPFGKTGYHSLTSVTFTPHVTSYNILPVFSCQERSGGFCSPKQLGNCNDCKAKPLSAWAYMSSLAKKYIKEEYSFTYEKSLFSIKPILQASEIDDSRPTVIKQFSEGPVYVSVLSGKINTLFDLDEVLHYGQK